MVRITALLTSLLLIADARAGLYYSGETIAELPSQWRGFLIDQRGLRVLAVRPANGAPVPSARARYNAEAEKLSPPYVAKLLSVLRQAGLITSVRGRTGGYHLVRPAAEVRLGEVMRATNPQAAVETMLAVISGAQ